MFVNFLPLNCVVGSSCGPGTCGGTAAGSLGGLATVRGKVLKKKESHNSVDETFNFV